MLTSEHFNDGPELLKPHEAAKLLGIHRATLARMRARVPGFPQPQNLGAGISRVYRKSELIDWLNTKWKRCG
jgi:predicted DNA-binding transcriptional regulator AlpA